MVHPGFMSGINNKKRASAWWVAEALDHFRNLRAPPQASTAPPLGQLFCPLGLTHRPQKRQVEGVRPKPLKKQTRFAGQNVNLKYY
jgi:hypothetical protein